MSEQIKGASPVEGIKPQTETPIQEQAKQSPEIDSKFAHLARKEQALRQQARKLQQMQSEFDAKKASSAPAPQYDWKNALKVDPLSVLSEAGLSHSDITNLVLNSKPEDIQMRKLQMEINALREEQRKAIEAQQQSGKSAYEQALKQVRRDVDMLVDSDEQFSTIKTTKSQDAVVALIEQTYKEDGILMSAEEASKQIEDYLVEEALEVAKLKKIQEKLAPPQAQPTAEEKTQAAKVLSAARKKGITISSRTLTNASQQVSTSSSPSESDRRQRAILAMQGKLTG